LIKSTAPWWVKIGDFGISKRLEEQEGNTTSSVKGTLHYMAPELFFFGPQDTDHEAACDYYKADIWAAGCITYFLLTKKHPSLNLRAMISECYGKPPLSTSGLSKHSVPEAARSFVAALLNVDPKEWPAAEEALEHEWLQAHYEEPLDDEMDEGL
jgi:serine/threonine protein kinase